MGRFVRGDALPISFSVAPRRSSTVFDKISDKISVEANGTRRDSVLTLCLGDQELHIMDASSNIRLCKTKKMPFLIEMSLSHGQASITNYIIAQ